MKSAVSFRDVPSALPTLNLSRAPFQNRRLFWVCWGFLTLIALGSLLFVYGRLREEDAASAALRQRVAREQKVIADLKATLAKPLVTELPPRDEHAVRSIMFLAGQRNFSWSRLMTQLELSLTKDVRLIQVNWPENSLEDTDETKKRLSLTVRAGTPEAVTKYLRETDRHRIFQFEAQSQKSSDRQSGIAEVEFILDGLYNPAEPGLSPSSTAATTADQSAPKAVQTTTTQRTRRSGR